MDDQKKPQITAVRTKWYVEDVKDFGYGAKETYLRGVYSNDKNSEDNQFSTATPSAEARIMVTNPETMDFFKPGKKYIATFVEAED